MAKATRTARRYESPRRKAQAETTRLQILEAAERLFVEDGYPSTSVASVAHAAGVSLKTVYLAFETKSGVLRALWHLRLRGDQGETPVGERKFFRAVLDEPDPLKQLQLNARNATRIRPRIGPLLGVIQAAAAGDPAIAELWARIQREFYENQKAVVVSLHAKKALRRGLGVTRAADILWTLNNPSVYRLLVVDRSWTPREYEKWLTESCTAQLLKRER